MSSYSMHDFINYHAYAYYQWHMIPYLWYKELLDFLDIDIWWGWYYLSSWGVSFSFVPGLYTTYVARVMP